MCGCGQVQPQLGDRDGRHGDQDRKPHRAAPHERHRVGEVFGGAGDDVAVVADERCHRAQREEERRDGPTQPHTMDPNVAVAAVGYGRHVAGTKKLFAALKRRGPHRVLRGDLSFAGLPGVVYTPESGFNLPGVAFGHEWLTGVGALRRAPSSTWRRGASSRPRPTPRRASRRRC